MDYGLIKICDFDIKKGINNNIDSFFLELSIQDSNLDWLIQSQMCYHYTNGQNSHFSFRNRVQKYYIFLLQPNLFLFINILY